MNKNAKFYLAIVITISVILRVAAAIALGEQVENLPGTADQISYHTLAIRILSGYGFTFGTNWWPVTAAGTPTAHWSYLYTGYLTLVYAIFGPNPIAARLIQAVLVGVLHPLLAYVLGKKVFTITVGLVAAALTAIYTYFVYYAATLMTEPFYIIAILASLLFSILLAERMTKQDGSRVSLYGIAIALGLTAGASLLLRQLLLFFVPVLFLWIWWAGGRRWTSALVLAGIVILLMIVPFTIYNYVRFERFVLLNTNAGYAFFWGNHPIHETHFVPIFPTDTYTRLIPSELRGLDEAALDQALLKIGLGYIIDDPGRYFLLSLSRIPVYFMFWPSSASGLVSNIARVAGFGLLLPLMLYGLVVAWIQRPKPYARLLSSPLFLLLLFIVLYTLIHILSWALVRYRLPVDAILVVFAGLGVVDLWQRIKLRRKVAEPAT
jgi:4-amino-4-deoxy-L-arabinose transferase-like glycosyltransferase